MVAVFDQIQANKPVQRGLYTRWDAQHGLEGIPPEALDRSALPACPW